MTMLDFSPPTDDADAVDVMKWMIAVMDKGDKALVFIASCLNSAIKWGGLTAKQAESVERVYDRVLASFERGVLEIQTGLIAGPDDLPANVTQLRRRS